MEIQVDGVVLILSQMVFDERQVGTHYDDPSEEH